MMVFRGEHRVACVAAQRDAFAEVWLQLPGGRFDCPGSITNNQVIFRAQMRGR